MSAQHVNPDRVLPYLTFVVGHHFGPSFSGPTGAHIFEAGLTTSPLKGWQIVRGGLLNICRIFAYREDHDLTWDGAAWTYCPAVTAAPTAAPTAELVGDAIEASIPVDATPQNVATAANEAPTEALEPDSEPDSDSDWDDPDDCSDDYTDWPMDDLRGECTDRDLDVDRRSRAKMVTALQQDDR